MLLGHFWLGFLFGTFGSCDLHFPLLSQNSCVGHLNIFAVVQELHVVPKGMPFFVKMDCSKSLWKSEISLLTNSVNPSLAKRTAKAPLSQLLKDFFERAGSSAVAICMVVK
jgi:hypothetical protein